MRDSTTLLTAMCVGMLNCKWMRAGQANGAYRGFWGLEAESENLLYSGVSSIQLQAMHKSNAYKSHGNI